jgi:hypothetical protein
MSTVHARVPAQDPARDPWSGTSKLGRVFGYTVQASVQGALLVVVNRTPGWDALPFLTSETPEVLPFVNASLVAALVASLVYAAWDPRWLRGLGAAVTAWFSCAACLRLWSVFPFDFGHQGVDWDLVARVALAFAIVGSAIAVLVGLVAFVRGLVRGD